MDYSLNIGFIYCMYMFSYFFSIHWVKFYPFPILVRKEGSFYTFIDCLCNLLGTVVVSSTLTFSFGVSIMECECSY